MTFNVTTGYLYQQDPIHNLDESAKWAGQIDRQIDGFLLNNKSTIVLVH